MFKLKLLHLYNQSACSDKSVRALPSSRSYSTKEKGKFLPIVRLLVSPKQ